MDLNILMRQTAETALQTRLDAAVADGDAETARKVSKEIAEFAVATAPKAPTGFTPDDVRAELNKLDWFGVDPKRSAKVMELGKNMDLKKFPTAADFAKAVVAAVDEEFKPAAEEPGEDDDETEPVTKKPEAKPAARRTDGPRDGDMSSGNRTSSRGPWTKLSDAPAEVATNIRRQATKFLPANATDEQKKKFTASQLEIAYKTHQATAKGK